MTNLRIPGPTPLPPAVLAAMQGPMVSHRGPETRALVGELRERLTRFHRTAGEVLLFPGSGTGALEAGIANLFSAGDRVLALIGGYFGERFARIARAYGLRVLEEQFAWGTAVEPARVRAALARHPEVKGVLFTHNETSTGVTNDLAAVGAVVREHGALLLCDAVSSVGALPLEMDAWGADVVLSGTQKAWMSPPGLAIVAIGARAWAAHERATLPRFFWDFTLARKAAAEGSTAMTPPLTTMYALQAALRLIDDEGLEQVWARHAALGAYTRQRLSALGFTLLPEPAVASNSVTAARPPAGIGAKGLVATLRQRYDVVLGGGQGQLADQIVRVGHLGYVFEADLAAALDAVADALAESGDRAFAGAGVPARA